MKTNNLLQLKENERKAIATKIMLVCNVDFSTALQWYSEFGNGCIYVPNKFFIRKNNSTNRKMLLKTYSRILVINSANDIQEYGRTQVQERRRKACKQQIQEQKNFWESREKETLNNYRNYVQQRKLFAFFNAGKGSVSPKKGGKGNALKDLGKYINEFSERLNDLP